MVRAESVKNGEGSKADLLKLCHVGPWDVAFPEDVAELLSLVAEGRRPLAGGTDLIPRAWHSWHSWEEGSPLVWVGGIEDLRSLKVASAPDDGWAELGAAITHADVLGDPSMRRLATALVDACGVVGSVQIRNVATVVGNVCNASPAADTVPALTVHEAEVLIGGPGERWVPLPEFLTGPGSTVLAPGEVVLGVRLRGLRRREGSAYRRFTVRRAMDLAFVGVAARVMLGVDRVHIEEAAIALGAVGPTVIVADAAAEALVGNTVEDSVLRECGGRAATQSRPISDLRASAEYRRHITRVLTQDVVRIAYERARLNDREARNESGPGRTERRGEV